MATKEEQELLRKLIDSDPILQQVENMMVGLRNDLLSTLEQPGQTVTINSTSFEYGDRVVKPKKPRSR